MSDSNPTLWNLTKPKHPEVDGSIVQICGEPIRESTFNWIKAGNLAGIVGVDFNGHLHYVWNPQIVNNLTGQPTKIIGNASNKKGEFSLIELNLGALKYFVLPMLKTQAPDGMHSGTTLTKVIYKDTKWKDNDEGTMVVSIIPKILPIFFGMDVPYGSLHEEDVAVLFSNLGTAYEAYVNAVLAHQTGNTSEHADTVVQVLKGMADGLAEFVDAQIPTRKEIGVNGPTIATIHANSSKYPEIAETIGKFFANSGGSNLSSSILGGGTTKIVVRSAEDDDREAIASDGIRRLQLFFLGGKIAADGSITNAQLATVSQSYQEIARGPKTAKSTRVKSLMMTGMETYGKANPLDILAKTSIHVIQDTLCTLFLMGRFATKPALTYAEQSNVVDLGAFLPQNSLSQSVKNAKAREDKNYNETLVGLSDALKSTPSTMVEKLGSIDGMKDIVSTLVNLNSMSNSFVDVKTMTANGDPPILLQLMLEMVEFLCSSSTEEWLKVTEETNKHVPFNVYAILDAVFACFGAGADNWMNNQVALQPNPDVSTLVMDQFNTGVQMFRTYMQTLRQLVLMNATDPNYSRLVPPTLDKSLARTPSGGGNKKRDEASSSTRTNNDSSTKKARTTTTAGGSGGGGGNKSSRKSTKTGPVRENQSGGSSHLGWCFCTSGDITQFVPASMGNEAPCAHFITQGYECSYSPTDCPHGKHIRTPNKVSEGNILKFAKHLSDTGCGYFNRRSIEKFDVRIPEDLNVLGNKDGLTQPDTST